MSDSGVDATLAPPVEDTKPKPKKRGRPPLSEEVRRQRGARRTCPSCKTSFFDPPEMPCCKLCRRIDELDAIAEERLKTNAYKQRRLELHRTEKAEKPSKTNLYAPVSVVGPAGAGHMGTLTGPILFAPLGISPVGTLPAAPFAAPSVAPVGLSGLAFASPSSIGVNPVGLQLQMMNVAAVAAAVASVTGIHAFPSWMSGGNYSTWPTGSTLQRLPSRPQPQPPQFASLPSAFPWQASLPTQRYSVPPLSGSGSRSGSGPMANLGPFMSGSTSTCVAPAHVFAPSAVRAPPPGSTEAALQAAARAAVWSPFAPRGGSIAPLPDSANPPRHVSSAVLPQQPPARVEPPVKAEAAAGAQASAGAAVAAPYQLQLRAPFRDPCLPLPASGDVGNARAGAVGGGSAQDSPPGLHGPPSAAQSPHYLLDLDAVERRRVELDRVLEGLVDKAHLMSSPSEDASPAEPEPAPWTTKAAEARLNAYRISASGEIGEESPSKPGGPAEAARGGAARAGRVPVPGGAEERRLGPVPAAASAPAPIGCTAASVDELGAHGSSSTSKTPIVAVQGAGHGSAWSAHE